jgi:hypothetical protein
MSNLNIRNAESAILKGYSRWSKFIEAFTAKWTEPIQDVILVRMWDTMDPAAKEQMKAVNPEAFNEVDSKIKGLRGD